MCVMGCFGNYLTRDGWKRDWDRTKQDFNDMRDYYELSLNNVSSRAGSVSTNLMLTNVGAALGVWGCNFIRMEHYVVGTSLSLGGVLFCVGGVVGGVKNFKHSRRE